VCGKIDFSKDVAIVEYGPGDGACKQRWVTDTQINRPAVHLNRGLIQTWLFCSLET
jgi:hypothetical protein